MSTVQGTPASAKLNPVKQIFVLSGREGCGKTTTLKEVFYILNNKYPNCKKNIILPQKYKIETNVKINIKFGVRDDIRITMEIGDTLIGIESCGDPSGIRRLEISLQYFKKIGCNIIFCAARENDNEMAKLINSYSKDVNFIEKKKEYDKQQQFKSNLEIAKELIKLAGL